MLSQSERFIRARTALQSNIQRFENLSHEIAVNGNTLEVPYLQEINSILAEYGFALAILRRDTNIVALVSDEQPNQEEGGVFGTEVANTLIEWRNGIYSSILNFFNNQDSLG